MSARIGIGYDTHRLVKDRPLILGGVTISYEKGLLGHSDADVLIHAVMDAMLGAAGLKDIGCHFPDNDPRYKNASSLQLLSLTNELVKKAGCGIVNIDTVIIAEQPKLSPYRDEMANNIAKALGISTHTVNVKATTEEGMGFTGAGQGISAQAVCLLEKEGVMP